MNERRKAQEGDKEGAVVKDFCHTTISAVYSWAHRIYIPWVRKLQQGVSPQKNIRGLLGASKTQNVMKNTSCIIFFNFCIFYVSIQDRF